MISYLISAVGGLVFLAGVVWFAVQWLAKPQGQQAIRIVDALTPGDLSKLLANVDLSTAAKPSQSRLEALGQADALMAYFESKGSQEGQAAVQQLVSAIFATKETK